MTHETILESAAINADVLGIEIDYKRGRLIIRANGVAITDIALDHLPLFAGAIKNAGRIAMTRAGFPAVNEPPQIHPGDLDDYFYERG